jgi:adenine-specific DNA methylase
MIPYARRRIEVDLPIKRISPHARREKSIRRGRISTVHIWWARRTLGAWRAVICAALWPDPADPLWQQDFAPPTYLQILARRSHRLPKERYVRLVQPCSASCLANR